MQQVKPEQTDAVALTPRHVCCLIVPSPSATSTSTPNTSTSTNTSTITALKESHFFSNSLNKDEKQQHGSYTSMPSIQSVSSIASSQYNTHTNNLHSNSNSNNNNGNNHKTRNISSASTVGSSTSTSTNTNTNTTKQLSIHHQQHQQQQQQQQQHQQTHTSSQRRPGTLGALASSANAQTSSPMKIAFHQYLLVPTIDGRLLIYQIVDFSNAQNSLLEEELQCHRHPNNSNNNSNNNNNNDNNITTQHMNANVNTATTTTTATSVPIPIPTAPNKIYHLSDVESYQCRIENVRAKTCRIQQEKEAVEPIYSIGPFYIGDYNIVKGNKTNMHNNTSASTSASMNVNVNSSNDNSTNNSDNPSSASSANGSGSSSGKGGGQEKVSASIVDICSYSMRTNSESSSLSHYIAILTNEGDVHILQFFFKSMEELNSTNTNIGTTGGSAATSTGHHHQQHQNRSNLYHKDLKIEHVTSFYSGNLGAMCFTMFHKKNSASQENKRTIDNTNTTTTTTTIHSSPTRTQNNINNFYSTLQIAIGHDNGIITCFEIMKPKTNSNNSNNKFSSILKWIGNFDANCSILSMTSIGNNYDYDDNNKNVTSSPAKKEEDDYSFCYQYLVVGMGQNPIDDFDTDTSSTKRESSPPSMAQCLEVVNISYFEQAWNEDFGNLNTCNFTSQSEAMLHSLPFDEFTVWPMREVFSDDNSDSVLINYPHSQYKNKNGSNRKSNKIRRDVMYGVNVVDVFHTKDDHAFVASMSDGTIAIIHYYKNKSPEPSLSELCWGVSCTKNKRKLPQPICDIGLLGQTADRMNEKGNSIVGCLRDGSIFIIPIIPMNSKDDDNDDPIENSDIVMYGLSMDSDNNSNINDHAVTRHIQGFTSGYVRVKDWGCEDPELDKYSWKHGRLAPLFFHAWPGGMIDCHACGLVPDFLSVPSPEISTTCDRKKTTQPPLSKMLQSEGVLEDLISFLLTLDLKNDSMSEGLVYKAALECNSLGGSVGEILKIVRSTPSSVDNHMVADGYESISRLINHLIFGNENKDLILS